MEYHGAGGQVFGGTSFTLTPEVIRTAAGAICTVAAIVGGTIVLVVAAKFVAPYLWLMI
jgi:hypothetical protein